jgi:hypothetical protein
MTTKPALQKILKGILYTDKEGRHHKARCWWPTPVILATQEAEIKRIVVQSQPQQIVHETLS